MLLFVPGAPLGVAAGALFGLWRGVLVVSLASTAAAALAFLAARHLARGAVERAAARRPRFRAVDEAIGREGWKVVGLLRLSPAIPYSLSNWLYGLTAVRFGPYVLVSWAAMLPGTCLYVSLGALGGAAAAGETRSRLEWTLLAVGLAATVAATLLVTRLARRALAERL